MLAITGGITLWYVSSVTNMRYGKYRLFAEVELLGKNPYTGEAYVFLSKDRQTLKIIRFNLLIPFQNSFCQCFVVLQNCLSLFLIRKF